MIFSRFLVPVCACGVILGGCSPADDIAQDGAIYDGIPADASITVSGVEPPFNFYIGPQRDGMHTVHYNPENEAQGFVFSASRFAGNNGIAFAGEHNGQNVQIGLSPGTCRASSTGSSFPYYATATIAGETLLGCAQVKQEPPARDQKSATSANP